MFLEKIKQHLGKALLVFTGLLMIMIGSVISKQRSLDKVIAELESKEQESLDTSLREVVASVGQKDVTVGTINDVQALQDSITADRQQKLANIANNPAVVKRQQTVAVTKTIPGATRKVAVPAGTVAQTSASSTTKQSSTPATSSTVASAPAAVKVSTPAPAKATKTS